jgi:integrase
VGATPLELPFTSAPTTVPTFNLSGRIEGTGSVEVSVGAWIRWSDGAAVSAAELRRMMEALPAGLLGVRDRALLLLGFAGGFRRSELIALNVVDLALVREGLEA